MKLDDYTNALYNYMGSDEFAKLDDITQQKYLDGARQKYIEKHPDIDIDSINRITEKANREFLRNTGRGRYVPTPEDLINIKFPNQEEGFNELSKEEKVERIEAFKLEIPEISKQYPTIKEDMEFFLSQSTRELERRANGEGRSKPKDLGVRAMQGLVSGLARYTGFEEAAKSAEDFFHENPEFDEDFSSGLAQAVGDVGAGMTIFIGSALATRVLGGSAAAGMRVGSAASLASNGIMRYNEAYHQAIEAGLDANQANDAGVAALPAAVVDVLGDRIIASKILPDNTNKIFSTGTIAEKKKALSTLVSDNSNRSKLFEIGRASMAEGVTEVVGDYIAAYRPYLTHGVDDYIPTDEELMKSFAIGSLIGGGISTASERPNLITGTNIEQQRLSGIETNLETIDQQEQQGVFNLLAQGDYKGALQLSNTLLEKSTDKTQATTPTLSEPTTVEAETVAPSSAEVTNELPSGMSLYEDIKNEVSNLSAIQENEEASSNEINDARSQRINSTIPDRANIHLQVDAALGSPDDEFRPESKIHRVQLKTLIDSAALNWITANPTRNPNEFYNRININSVEAAVVQQNENQVDSTSRIIESSLIQSFRESGLLEEIVNEVDKNQLQSFLGVESLDSSSDPILVEEFTKWRNNEETPASDIFQKIFNIPEEVPSQKESPVISKVVENKTVSPVAISASEVLEQAKAAIRRRIAENAAQIIQPPSNADTFNAIEFFDHDENINPAAKILAESIRTKNPDLRIQIDSNFQAPGAYFDQENLIIVRDTNEVDLIHEVTHALTRADIRVHVENRSGTYKEKLKAAKADPDTPVYIKTLIDVYENAAFETGREDIIGEDATDIVKISALDRMTYSFINLDEFMAEAMSNSDFQESLASIPYRGKTIWREIIDAIKSTFQWMSAFGSPELLMKSKRQNSLSATMASINAIISTPVTVRENIAGQQTEELNINFSPDTITRRQDQLYEELHATGDIDRAKELVDLAAIRAGYDVERPMYRGDTFEWEIADRPIYLTPDYDLADEFAKSGINQEATPRKFYIKDNLRLAKPGDVVNGRKLQTSSYLNQFGLQTNVWGFVGTTSFELKVSGYHGMEGPIDGAKDKQEIVLIDGNNMKLAEPFTYDIEGKLIPLSQRFDTQKNNINYSPDQTRSKRVARGYERYQRIIKGNLNDKSDIRTVQIQHALSQIKATDIARLSNEEQEWLFVVIDNIYEARRSGISNPQSRINSDAVLQELAEIRDLLDAYAVQDMVDSYDGLVNFDGIDITDREAVMERIDEYHRDMGIQEELPKDSKRKARIDRIYNKYRARYKEMREAASNRFVDDENYITEIEAVWSGKINEEYLRNFVKAHFNYLMTVNIDNLSGKELYQHFFALNNLLDNNFINLHITAKYIAEKRNRNEDVSQFANTFRDPSINSNKFWQALDKLNQQAELIQTQALRFSALTDSKQFIQEKLMGPLFDAIMRTSYNRKKETYDTWLSNKAAFEETIGREMNVEDRVLISIFARLTQFEVGSDPDSELKQNIEKERKSINNIIIHGSPDNKKLHRTRVLPLFEAAVKDVNTMSDLLSTITERMKGTDTTQVGKVRVDLLNSAQQLFAQFDLESRIISEGFHGQPFRQIANYITNDVLTDKEEIDETVITDSLDKWEYIERATGIKSKAGHLHARRPALGDRNHFSYNIENTIDRNVERISVDNATIGERFILSERLKKGSQLHDIIALDEDGNVHQERIDGLMNLAKKLVSNAFSRGEPLNVIVSALRIGTNMYARPTLSSIHHIVTQPLAAFTDYAVRTGNYKGWMEAASFLAGNMSHFEEWLMENQRWTGERGALEAMALDIRRSPIESDNKFRNNPFIKRLETYYEGAGNIITFALRNGDRFSTKATLLAEYVRLLKEKGYNFNSLQEFDWNTVEGNILTQATLNVERNINTSNKILRGELFSDRRQTLTVLRNALLAFASHASSLSTQAAIAMRDLKNLKAMGATKGQMEQQIRIIGAIMLQSFTFTTARYTIGAMTTAAMIALIKDLFDDEEGKIAELQEKVYIEEKKGDPVRIANARHELDNAKTVRSVVEKMRLRSQSGGSWFKQVIRDEMGSFFIGFSSDTVNQMNPIFWMSDPYFQKVTADSIEEIAKDYRSRIAQAKKDGRLKEAALLTEKLVSIEATEYIPFVYADVGGVGLGGLYGSMFGGIKRQATEFTQGSISATELSFNDLIISASIVGLGQSEMSKTLNAIDQIEDKQWKRNKSFEEEKVPQAQQRKEDQNKRKRLALMRSLGS